MGFLRKKNIKIKLIGKVKIFKISGRFTLMTTPEICKLCEEEVRGGENVKGILLDFENVEDVDTTAFACMFNFMKHHMSEGMKVGIIHYNQKVKDLMRILKIDKMIPAFANEEEAMREISRDTSVR